LYENCPLRYFRQRIVKDVVDEGGEASKYGERIHKFLENRLTGSDLPHEVASYEPLCKMVERLAANGELHVEKELVLNDELVPTTWWAPDAWLRSKLDVMIIRGDTAIVMDWKTGKRNPDFFQMQIFAAQVLKHYPDVHKVVTILTWLKGMSQDFEYYNRETINKSWTTIMEKIRRIHDSLDHDNWPARPSGLCRFCPARHNCDYAKV
jgi:hypothetical protein